MLPVIKEVDMSENGNYRPLVGITTGDPAGVGPEVITSPKFSATDLVFGSFPPCLL